MPCSTSFEDEHMLPPYSPQNPFRLRQIENPWSPPAQRWACIRTIKKVTKGTEITDDVLAECVKLFNISFGVWSEMAKNQNSKIVPGSKLRTTTEYLRAECIPCEEKTTLVRIYIQDKLVGYAFGTRWSHHTFDGDVCWITQVVVDQNYRGVGLATSLLSKFKTNTDVLYGIKSHHPAAIMALKRAVSGHKLSCNDLLYTRSYARDILQKSIIESLQGATLHGRLFNDTSYNPEEDGIVCCIKSGVKLAYDDALLALKYLEQKGRSWGFGKLRYGFIFIALIENESRR